VITGVIDVSFVKICRAKENRSHSRVILDMYRTHRDKFRFVYFFILGKQYAPPLTALPALSEPYLQASYNCSCILYTYRLAIMTFKSRFRFLKNVSKHFFKVLLHSHGKNLIIYLSSFLGFIIIS